METSKEVKVDDELKGIQLKPFDYHIQLKEHFKRKKKTWDWFAEKNNKEEQIQEFKSNLLKNSYRLDNKSHKELYHISNEICQTLSLDAEVTFYQQHNSIQLNAGISIINKEAHIVLSGNLLSLLDKDELKALLAHELSHYLFYKMENEEFEITQRIILALANDPRSEDSYIETARIFQLYQELFCDAGSLIVCKDYKVVIQTLVKMNTGLSKVNAESYLKQAKEIIMKDSEATQNISHPEAYIRSLALERLALNSEKEEISIKELIEGKLNLNKLDIFNQKELQELTHHLLQLVVKPNWINTPLVMNLCKQYFNDFFKNEKHKSIEEFAKEIEKVEDSVKTYFSYVLLDFAKVSHELELLPLAHTLEISEYLEIKNEYEKIVRKELKMTHKDFKTYKEKAMLELQSAKEDKNNIYND